MLSVTCKTLSFCFLSHALYHYLPHPHGTNVHNPLLFVSQTTLDLGEHPQVPPAPEM